MGAHMSLKPERVTTRVLTETAHIWSFFCVYPHVSPQLGLLHCRIVTLWTLLRLLLCVSRERQIKLSLPRLITMLVSCLSFNIFYQNLNLNDIFQKFFSMVKKKEQVTRPVFNVTIEFAFRSERVITLYALEWLDTHVSVCVIGQCGLILEHLVTEFALERVSISKT